MSKSDSAKWFFNTIIELFNQGQTEMVIDYEKKNGEQNQLKLTITEVNENEQETSEL